VFFSTFTPIFKTLLSLLFLVLFLRIKERLKPYKNPLLNSLETKEHFASVATFFGALFFMNNEISKGQQIGVFIGILLVNLSFLGTWVYALLQNFQKYECIAVIARFLGKVFTTKEVRMEEDEFREAVHEQKLLKSLREAGSLVVAAVGQNKSSSSRYKQAEMLVESGSEHMRDEPFAYQEVWGVESRKSKPDKPSSFRKGRMLTKPCQKSVPNDMFG